MSGSSERSGPVLLLTSNRNTDGFRDWLVGNGREVVRLGEPLDIALACEVAPCFVVSFNYRHIVPEDVIRALGCGAVNVHCSVLPWNRGASPNFFSYLHDTPKGVTVHRLTAGLDKGDILLQRALPLTDGETFASSYGKLISCAEGLLRDNWDALLSGKLKGMRQPAGGSYNTVADFEAARARWPFEWGTRVRDWKRAYGIG